MALLGKVQKQPREILAADISYSKVVGIRHLQSLTPAVEVPAGMALEGTVVSGNILQIRFSGGTTANTYRWVVLTDLVIDGQTIRVEDEFDVVVLEV